MTSPLPAVRRDLKRYACSLCARRKVKCDKKDPCTNCLKTQARCQYTAPAPHRPRKRTSDEDLLVRLALYEDLMRKHNIDFSRFATTWVPSTIEPKEKERDQQTAVSMISAATQHNSKVYASENTTTDVEPCLWSSLSFELKYPPIQRLRHEQDPLRHPAQQPLRFTFRSNQPELHELHPESKHIFRLWQIFIERIHPLTKIVHVPTLQQHILDASWDLSKASKPLIAIMFAIYNLAITPMSSDDCLMSFGETKDTLLTRYRDSTVRALIEADFLTTRELMTLQALILFLFTDPESELTCNLTSVAISLGQKMGLHQENHNPKITFFEKEMRIRLWWQLRCLSSRSRAFATPSMRPLPPSEFGDIRLPLNVNDVDLHPDMADPPIEHDGPTEMLCVMMKFEFLNWIQSSPKAAQVFNQHVQSPLGCNTSMDLEDETIDELEGIYQEKLLRHWDNNIPLHRLTHAVANFTVSRLRFKVHHPRGRASNNGDKVYMNKNESDMLFDAALVALEMVDVSIRGKLSSHLFTHMTFTFQLDVYIYVISDLRRRCSGGRVALAWRLVEDLYNEHPELVKDAENTFFVALGDLTLEAWKSRMRELADCQHTPESNFTPQFIQQLLDKRKNVIREHDMISIVPDPHSLDNLVWMEDSNLNWEFWNEFLRI